jgi:hypothetical protein
VFQHYVRLKILHTQGRRGKFTDVLRLVAWGDYDADGDLDLYLTSTGGPNRLYQNNGNSTFTDKATLLGVNNAGAGQGAAWGDYDNDGDLDLYVANYGQANILYTSNINPVSNTYFKVVALNGSGCPSLF